MWNVNEHLCGRFPVSHWWWFRKSLGLMKFEVWILNISLLNYEPFPKERYTLSYNFMSLLFEFRMLILVIKKIEQKFPKSLWNVHLKHIKLPNQTHIKIMFMFIFYLTFLFISKTAIIYLYLFIQNMFTGHSMCVKIFLEVFFYFTPLDKTTPLDHKYILQTSTTTIKLTSKDHFLQSSSLTHYSV